MCAIFALCRGGEWGVWGEGKEKQFTFVNFDTFLTVHPSIILVTDQPNIQILVL